MTAPAIHSPKAAAELDPTMRFQEIERAPATKHRPEPMFKAEWQFSSAERARIQQYAHSQDSLAGKPKHLPPGLAKKVARGGRLPPGWQKKCLPGQIMPAEVFQRCWPLPRDLVVTLPPAPEPTITVAIGGKVVRLIEATRQILDVFDVSVNF